MSLSTYPQLLYEFLHSILSPGTKNVHDEGGENPPLSRNGNPGPGKSDLVNTKPRFVPPALGTYTYVCLPSAGFLLLSLDFVPLLYGGLLATVSIKDSFVFVCVRVILARATPYPPDSAIFRGVFLF